MTRGPEADTARRCRLSVHARPGARTDSIRWDPWRSAWIVSVTAPPVGGGANRAIRALLAEHLQVAMDSIEFLRAGTSPSKTLEILGLDDEEVRRRLSAPGATPSRSAKGRI